MSRVLGESVRCFAFPLEKTSSRHVNVVILYEAKPLSQLRFLSLLPS